MKKRLLFPLLFAVIAALFAVFGIFWWKSNSKPISSDQTSVSFIVTKGKSASQVGQMLYEEGLIRNPLAFKLYVQLSDKSGQIQAGEFELSKSMTLKEIVESFSKGPLEIWVTIPEGLRREEVVEKVIAGLEMDSKRAASFRQEFLIVSKGIEGYLFPNTYLFPRDVSAQVVVERMKSLFDSQTVSVVKTLPNGFTLEEVITLASIIERETKTDEERPVVAGIYFNRLEIGMALQADAATQYAVASAKCIGQSAKCDWWPILTRADLEIDSPYNTYKYASLPPTPIANPGLSSIKAAMNPTANDYFYYIHDPSGKIHYAETLQGHNENVSKYLRK